MLNAQRHSVIQKCMIPDAQDIVVVVVVFSSAQGAKGNELTTIILKNFVY